MSETVSIEQAEYEAAENLAIQTLKIFEQRMGHYNNTLNSHLRGKIGEIACARWLDMQGLTHDSVFEDLARMTEADLIINAREPFRLDVKTWDTRYWQEMGRCIAFKQLPKLSAKADAVLWCISPSKLAPPIQVEIVGWSTIEDIRNSPRRMTGPSGRRQVDNYQVDLGTVRQLSDLHGMLM